ncbi:hypothetical protein KM043_009559 [Ampulex compressa]|nr:hypothetical protein KM043_009559 [Ampulex compressa]
MDDGDGKRNLTADDTQIVENCNEMGGGACATADCASEITEQKIAPPYFPQPEDELPAKPGGPMEAVGPWATGRLTFTPKDGLTGVVPVVDRYSVTRSGPSRWRAQNLEAFQEADEKINYARLVSSDAKYCVQKAYKETDKTQFESTDHLRTRANTVAHWKEELSNAILDITKEIEFLEAERRRVKQSLSVLTIPKSIAGEFLQLRSNRLEKDLVRDDVEEELTKEIALCSEIQDVLDGTRQQIETQLMELKAAKERMENDWTDKIDAYTIDSQCMKLTNASTITLWRPGATRFPADQSTPSSYEHFTRESLASAVSARQRSVDLRSTLNAIYTNSIKDLRDQATRVDVALEEKIKLTEEVCQRLERKLLECLNELASTEKLIEELRDSTKGLDSAMKVAQTRLSERLLRRNVESCRDIPQYALVDEVKSLNERVSAALAELKRAEKAQAELVKTRGTLEREISIKRKTLYIDKERGQLLRSFYPSATDLAGF